jgi:hypothetical protein
VAAAHPRHAGGVVDWLLRSRETGRLTLFQRPNLPLALFLVAALVRVVVSPHGGVRTAVSVVGTAALLWWAVDEVLRGVNPFRRMLGGVVAVAVVGGLVRR